jgi:hypothetical protein
MKELIAFCGLVCSECPAFIATRNNDDNKRKETAEIWSKQFNADIKPEDINCDGCISNTGNLFNYPKVCEIRKCGKEKGVINCAYCNDYACEKLEGFFEMVPDAKKRLDSIRNRNM